MTKILTVGDLHFNEGDLILPQLFIKKIKKLLTEKDYDLCILLGDVFHKFKNTDQPTLSSVTELFSVISDICPLFVIVGNHDYINGSQFLTQNHMFQPFKRWENVKIVDKPKILKMPDCRLLMTPYVPKGRFLEALGNVKWEKVDMIFAHQEFKGSKMGGHTSVDGDVWSKKFPPVISGHAHTKHEIDNIYYIGTPYDTSYGGGEKKYVCEILFDEDKYKMNYIEMKLPRKQTVSLTIDKAKEWFPKENNFYKLKIVSTKSEYSAFKDTSHAKELIMAGVKLIHVNTDSKRVEEYLKNKKSDSNGCESYRDIFKALVEKEGLQDLSKQIF